MGIMEIIGIAGSVSLLSGWRLYLCIFATGLAMRLGALPIPEHLASLSVLANPWVMGIAALRPEALFGLSLKFGPPLVERLARLQEPELPEHAVRYTRQVTAVWAGFFLANGFSGHGFQQCHAVGRYIDELMVRQQLTLDLAIFSPQRILENKPVFESRRKII